MDNEILLKKLKKPNRPVDVILDTDTYNEIDDQFALAYLLKSPDKLHLQAIYAAPFSNMKAKTPAEGMEKSYQEILHVLELTKETKYVSNVYRGSTQYLPGEKEYVSSDAAKNLVERAMSREVDNPLYVVAIGAISNIASALLIEPKIKDRIVVVWLGGNSYDWPDTREFNMYQDIAAARVVFGSGVPVVQLPCMGVVSQFITTGPELEYWLRGKNKLCDYLVDIVTQEAALCHGGKFWSRAIWDVTAVGWLLDENFMYDRLEYCPIPQYDDHYSFDKTGHFIKYVYAINRDKLMEDLLIKLAK